MFRGGAAASLAMTDRRAFSTVAPRRRKVLRPCASASRSAVTRASPPPVARPSPRSQQRQPEEPRRRPRGRRSSHLTEAQVPTHDPRGGEDTRVGPWVGPETHVDFVLALSPKYEEDLRCSLERTAKAHQAFGLQRIHEDAVPLPIQLRFERLLRIIGRAIPAHHHEELLSTFHWNTLEADQIPTVQQPEIPQIPGRCKGSIVPLAPWATGNRRSHVRSRRSK